MRYGAAAPGPLPAAAGWLLLADVLGEVVACVDAPLEAAAPEDALDDGLEPAAEALPLALPPLLDGVLAPGGSTDTPPADADVDELLPLEPEAAAPLPLELPAVDPLWLCEPAADWPLLPLPELELADVAGVLGVFGATLGVVAVCAGGALVRVFCPTGKNDPPVMSVAMIPAITATRAIPIRRSGQLRRSQSMSPF
ncbi:MAG TPA: hypothetical protein VKA00_08525 [Trueperaceae bacterium]|nr:hypothetical protein [Trueperaceae bacterium]